MDSDYEVVYLKDGKFKRRRHTSQHWQYYCPHGKQKTQCDECIKECGRAKAVPKKSKTLQKRKLLPVPELVQRPRELRQKVHRSPTSCDDAPSMQLRSTKLGSTTRKPDISRPSLPSRPLSSSTPERKQRNKELPPVPLFSEARSSSKKPHHAHSKRSMSLQFAPPTKRPRPCGILEEGEISEDIFLRTPFDDMASEYSIRRENVDVDLERPAGSDVLSEWTNKADVPQVSSLGCLQVPP